VPGRIQCSAPTVAQRGIAYGMPCLQVDGNDIFATVYAMRQATERARKEGKPSFIEMVTYRLGDHTTADDASRYRDKAEVDAWKAKDPLIRVRKHLERLKLWNDAKEAELVERSEKLIAEAVARAENIAAPHSSDFFNSMYSELPSDLALQRDTMQTHSLGQDPGQLSSTEHLSKPAEHAHH
jgi:pyruvate dehydrogenase E1 component alpha subunit